MERVQDDADWSLFCPKRAPGLADACGEAFKALYERYEREGRAARTVKARDVWHKYLHAIMQSSAPYVHFKDAVNRKSNQRNLGTIRSSNLCGEILEYSSPEETAVCNLASVALPAFVRRAGDADDGRGVPFRYDGDELRRLERWFDFGALGRAVEYAVEALDRIIDVTHYPVESARLSNARHRPIGVGVQGLADAFQAMGFAFDGPEAAELNARIFETIYYHALRASCELARRLGAYSSFAGSPASRGLLQMDLWAEEDALFGRDTPPPPHGDKYDWDELRALVRAQGLRNSLLVAPMPTASTAQILGNSESIDPHLGNVYLRRVLSGEFPVVNARLIETLREMCVWTDELRQRLIADNGSVARWTDVLPPEVLAVFRTAWEVKQNRLVDMAADRGRFICQGQSFNLYVPDATRTKLGSVLFRAWKKGLKTGVYYLRSRPSYDPVKLTVDVGAGSPSRESARACSRASEEGCEACGA